MVILRKKIIVIKSTEDFVKEFPAASEFIQKNQGWFQELALEYDSEALFLQHIISMFIKEMNLHFFVFATIDQVFVFELNFDNVIIINDEIKVMSGKKHLEQFFTDFVFNRYKHHPPVAVMEKKNRTYEMAIDVYNKYKDIDIKLIEK